MITEVIYRETTGPVDPNTAWTEVYTVSTSGSTFERIGFSVTTTVNEGTWVVNIYGAHESDLFGDLSGTDVYFVKKIIQNPLPMGGGIKQYTIRYDNGETREVIIGDGSIYNNAGLITTPINDYIANVVLPAGATSRYK
jgi:hypothetical protein